MKKRILIGLSIILCLILMATPVMAAGGSAAVSSAAGASGSTVYLTVSISGFEEADTLSITVSGDLALDSEKSEWLREDGILEGFDRADGVWATAEKCDLNGDIAKLAFTVPATGTEHTVSVTVRVKDDTVHIGTVSATGKVTVTKPATELVLNLNALALTLGGAETADLTATVTPADTTDVVVWSSSDETVASVVNGKVIAHKTGTAVITATAGSVSKSCAVTVDCAHDMGEWEVTKEPAIGVEGEKERSCKREGCTHTETETIPMLKWNVAFANMSLSNSLAMNFAFAQGNETDWTGCYAKITKTYADGRPDAVVTLPASQWGKATISGVPHYTISFQGIAAKEMGDEIHVCIYDAEGEAVSNVWTDSALKYALRAYNAEGAKETEKRMLIDMLNYGAAAQQLFEYDAEHLVTAELTKAQQAMATQDVVAKSSQVKGANYLGTNLSLESEIRINMAFKGVSEGMYAKVSFTNHAGRKVEEVAQMDIENGTGIVRVNQIAVADGRTMVTVTVHKADGSVHGSVVDSLEGYIARVIDNEPDRAPLYKKILMFADSTYHFKHG